MGVWHPAYRGGVSGNEGERTEGGQVGEKTMGLGTAVEQIHATCQREQPSQVMVLVHVSLQ